ncbi:MAG: site-specific integrase [Nodosilinea sp.]
MGRQHSCPVAYRTLLTSINRHPEEMGKAEIEAFLTYLAVEGQVSASIQNQARSALLLLSREVLDLDITSIDAVRAKRPQPVPTRLTKAEAPAASTSHGQGKRQGQLEILAPKAGQTWDRIH